MSAREDALQRVIYEAMYNEDETPRNVLDECQSGRKEYSSGGISVVVEFESSDTISDFLIDWFYELLKNNMYDLYRRNGWRWSSHQKTAELYVTLRTLRLMAPRPALLKEPPQLTIAL